MSGWRPALRIARREVRLARVRSLVVVAMIGLPVAGVVAADTLVRTQDVSPSESLPRELGSADARVYLGGVSSRIVQTPDLTGQADLAGGDAPKPTVATVRRLLGPGTRAIPLREGSVRVRTDRGVATVRATEVDLDDAMTRGLFELRDGRWPRTADEIVAGDSTRYRAGDGVRLLDGRRVRVVGVASSADSRSPFVAGPVGALRLADDADGSFLVDRRGGVPWDVVQAANRAGVAVLSAEVVRDPPPSSRVDPRARAAAVGGGDALPIFALVAVMGLLEVVLLAGPAFAVGARRRERTLALLAATGGEPRHMRRVVLAGGVVLGGVGALAGAALGLLAARAAVGPLQGLSLTRFGPFDVAPSHVVAIAAFGLLSAVLAAAAPAWVAARQDVVATLAGRRADRPPSRRSPALGALLLLAGIALSAVGARGGAGGEYPVALGALLAVVGMVLLVPVVLALLGRAGRGLALPLRFALRDAARHRIRTTPAVAAVAATVVGITALGIAFSSDALQSQRTYQAFGPLGDGVVTGEAGTDWTAVTRALGATLPGTDIRRMRGATDVALRVRGRVAPTQQNPTFGSTVLVARGDVAALGLDLSAAEARRADATLAAGGAVLFGAGPAGVRRIAAAPYLDEGRATGAATAPVAFVTSRRTAQPADAIVAPALADALGLDVTTRALLVSGRSIDATAEAAAQEAVAGVDDRVGLVVERGFQDSDRLIVLLILGGLGGMLVLGGTLTATSLALSDARPDLATLAAVGAPPGTRRLVAAAYAAAIALIGAGLGVVVGLVPGLAAGWVVGANANGGVDGDGVALPAHFISVPWPLLAVVVVGLPLLVAAIMALATRSRLPMTARLG